MPGAPMRNSATVIRKLAALEHNSQINFWLHNKMRLSIGLNNLDTTKGSENSQGDDKRYNADSRGTVGYVNSFCEEGRSEAMEIVHPVDHPDIRVGFDTYICLLRECIHMKSLQKGRKVHAHMIKGGFKPDTFVDNHLIDMYVKCGFPGLARQVFDKMATRNAFSWNILISGYTQCGRIDDARQLFDKMSERDAVSWNSMISGYAQLGSPEEAWELFCGMQRAGLRMDQFTFASILNVSVGLYDLEQGKQVHSLIIKTAVDSNVFVGSALVDTYTKCGRLKYACRVFYRMPTRNLFSWNAMIAGYNKCGRIQSARDLFNQMPERDLVSWNSMIAGYSHLGHGREALKLFGQMQQTGMKPNEFTVASILNACAALEAIKQGKEAHAYVIKSGCGSNVFVGSSLVDMYTKCGSLEYAHHLFDKMPRRDVFSCTAMIVGYVKHGSIQDARQLFDTMSERSVVSWTVIIAAYAQLGHGEEAIKLFRQMLQASVMSDQFTFATVLNLCASRAALEQGKQVHAHIIRTGFESNVFVGSAFVDMYAKCGKLEYALEIFENIPERDVALWNAMVAGYAQHGYGKEALQLFEQMLRSGTEPDRITFIGVLSACSHAGLVSEGRHYFDSMRQDHLITPGVDHFACMIDLLGRAGCLDEAEVLIGSMPFEPDANVWGALLGACRIHNNMELGRHAAEHLFELEPQNASRYVLLSNIYAAVGMWDDVVRVRKMMKDRGIKKKPGCSWIEVKNKMHAFVSKDRSHAQTEEIYAMLERLEEQMKEAGYLPDTNFVLHDVE